MSQGKQHLTFAPPEGSVDYINAFYSGQSHSTQAQNKIAPTSFLAVSANLAAQDSTSSRGSSDDSLVNSHRRSRSQNVVGNEKKQKKAGQSKSERKNQGKATYSTR
jgi:hypothetical protein